MKTKMPYAQATSLAEILRDALAQYCTRIETVGSIRRKKQEVGDIELIAIPNFTPDMFGAPHPDQHELNNVEWHTFGSVVKNGTKYKQIALHEGINLDLFIVTPPAQYGVQKLIRTGPAEYSHKFVTKKLYGGILPSHMKVEGGALWEGGKVIATPEEEDVYRVIDLPYIEPEKRGMA